MSVMRFVRQHGRPPGSRTARPHQQASVMRQRTPETCAHHPSTSTDGRIIPRRALHATYRSRMVLPICDRDHKMDEREVARILEEIGTLLELQGESPFKSRAYYTAERVISGLHASSFHELVHSGKLQT